MNPTPGPATAALQERFTAAFMPTYGVPPVALARGAGCRAVDVDGREYLDLIAGIAVSALGHGHPALVTAVTEQVAALAHTSNLFLHEREVELAERLLSLLAADRNGGARVFLTNSGTEANEAALKLVRRAAPDARRTVVAAADGFHGRTLGALGVTGKTAIREPFGPFGLDVRFVPYGDADALAAAVDDSCLAVFVEPIQGEAGVVPPPAGYLARVRAACDATGAALVLDEIQSGIGRTGHWFAHQAEGVVPDVLTLAKGLGGGLPIGACVGFGRHADAFAKGDHGSTFGGNPVACAAALAVLDTVDRDGLLGNAADRGEQLAIAVADLAARADGSGALLAGVRGRGLWRGVVLARPVAAQVQRAAAWHGFLVNAVAADVIRLAPPLVITAAEITEFTDALPAILATAAELAEGAEK